MQIYTYLKGDILKFSSLKTQSEYEYLNNQ